MQKLAAQFFLLRYRFFKRKEGHKAAAAAHLLKVLSSTMWPDVAKFIRSHWSHWSSKGMWVSFRHNQNLFFSNCLKNFYFRAIFSFRSKKNLFLLCQKLGSFLKEASLSRHPAIDENVEKSRRQERRDDDGDERRRHQVRTRQRSARRCRKTRPGCQTPARSCVAHGLERTVKTRECCWFLLAWLSAPLRKIRPKATSWSTFIA